MASRAVVRLAGSRDFETAQRIEREIAELIEQFHSAQGGFSFTSLLSELVEILVKKGLRLSPDLFLMVKTLITIEGIATILDPNFNFTDHLKSFAETLIKDRLDTNRLQKRFTTVIGDYADLIQNIPGDYYKAIQFFTSGKMLLSIEESSLRPIHDSLLKASTALVFSTVLMGLIIGSSVIVHAGVPPLWNEVSVIGIVGFFFSCVIGFGLLIKIMRNKSL